MFPPRARIAALIDVTSVENASVYCFASVALAAACPADWLAAVALPAAAVALPAAAVLLSDASLADSLADFALAAAAVALVAASIAAVSSNESSNTASVSLMYAIGFSVISTAELPL